MAVFEHPSLVAICIIRSGKPSVVDQQHIVAFSLANDNVVNTWVTDVTLCAQNTIVWDLTDWVGSTIVFHLRSFSVCGAAGSSLFSLRTRKHCSHLVFPTVLSLLIPFSVTAKSACIVKYFLKNSWLLFCLYYLYSIGAFKTEWLRLQDERQYIV